MQKISGIWQRSGAGLTTLIVLTTLIGFPLQAEELSSDPGSTAAERILKAVDEPGLRRLLREVLDRNPELRAAHARAEALAQRPPQVRALPDPEARLTAYADGPETRVGEQRWTVSLMQDLPAPGKRPLRRRQAELEAQAARAQSEALALERVTEALELAVDATFHQIHRGILQELLHHLGHHEEIARSRLSTGLGGEAEVARLQARMTEVEVEVLQVEAEQASVQARLNRLRDRSTIFPFDAAVDLTALPAPMETVEGSKVEKLLRRYHPAMAAARLRLEAARAAAELAGLESRPETSLGLTFTEVSGRDDPLGRLNPPAGDGRDVVGIVGRISLPFRRRPLEAVVNEAVARVREAEQRLEAQAAELQGEAEEALARLPLEWRGLRLLETVLLPQLEHNRRAAEAGYAAGRGEISSVLMAEHHLLEARLSIARERAAYARSMARLWGAVGLPLGPRAPSPADSKPVQDPPGAQP